MQTAEIQPFTSQFEAKITQPSWVLPPEFIQSQEYLAPELELITQMLTHAPGIIAEVVSQPENENRPGGCLVIWKKDRNPPLIYQIGQMLKPDKYPVFAVAKAKLLRDLVPSARLSGENLQLEPDQRAQVEFAGQFFDIPHGAVATTGGWIIAFSGFAQEWDAAASLAIAVKSGAMSLVEAEQIAEQSIPTSQERTIEGCFSKLRL